MAERTTNQIAFKDGKSYCLPFAVKDGSMVVTCGYHPLPSPDDPLHPSGHKGIDLRCPEGTPLLATEDGGVVADAGYSSSAGNYVKVTYPRPDGASVTVTYLHMQSISVAKGQSVNAGTAVGLSGNTGRSTGPHLHLQVQAKSASGESTTIDPSKYLVDTAYRAGFAYTPQANSFKLYAKSDYDRGMSTAYHKGVPEDYGKAGRNQNQQAAVGAKPAEAAPAKSNAGMDSLWGIEDGSDEEILKKLGAESEDGGILDMLLSLVLILFAGSRGFGGAMRRAVTDKEVAVSGLMPDNLDGSVGIDSDGRKVLTFRSGGGEYQHAFTSEEESQLSFAMSNPDYTIAQRKAAVASVINSAAVKTLAAENYASAQSQAAAQSQETQRSATMGA